MPPTSPSGPSSTTAASASTSTPNTTRLAPPSPTSDQRTPDQTNRSAWFASDFAAEGPPRNGPRLVVSSDLLRGAINDGAEDAAAAEEAVGGDEVGDLLAGDRG